MSHSNNTPRDRSEPYLVFEDVPDNLRARAVRKVAALATDTDDCAELLDALGLTADEGRPDART